MRGRSAAALTADLAYATSRYLAVGDPWHATGGRDRARDPTTNVYHLPPPVELGRILDDQPSSTAFVFERLRKQPEIWGDLVMLEVIGKLDRQAVVLAAEYCLFLSVDEIAPLVSLAQHEQDGGIQRVAAKSRAVDREAAGQYVVDLQADDHLAGFRCLSDRVRGQCHAKEGVRKCVDFVRLSQKRLKRELQPTPDEGPREGDMPQCCDLISHSAYESTSRGRTGRIRPAGWRQR